MIEKIEILQRRKCGSLSRYFCEECRCLFCIVVYQYQMVIELGAPSSILVYLISYILFADFVMHSNDIVT